jgi:hypothetical protein
MKRCQVMADRVFEPGFVPTLQPIGPR